MCAGLRPQARFGAQPPQSGGIWRGDNPRRVSRTIKIYYFQNFCKVLKIGAARRNNFFSTLACLRGCCRHIFYASLIYWSENRGGEDTAMDETTRRMMEQLGSNPAALRRLMQSRDGQTLMQALTRPDNGAGLQRAVQAAMQGNTAGMAELVNRVAQSPEGAALLERISRSAGG